MTTRQEENRVYRPTSTYYHANGKGTGSAIQFELHPAHDDVSGSIFATLAAQKSTGGFANGVKTFSTFDWANKICVRLDRSDLAQILEVFRGMQESIQEGKGLFHRTAQGNTIIRFSHLIEPRPGYLLSVSKKSLAGGEVQHVQFLFTPSEALELSCAIEGAMVYISFGIPMVIPRPARLSDRERANEPASGPVALNDPF